MAKFIIDTCDNIISKSMLEMILENHLDYNVYVKEIKPINENKVDELAVNYADAIFGKKETIINNRTLTNYNAAKKDFKFGYKKALEL